MPISPMLFLAVTLALGPQGFKPATKPVKAAKPKPPVVLPASTLARVDGTDITLEDVKGYITATGGRKVLQEIVQKIIIEREAKRLGVRVTTAEITEKVNEEQAKIVAQMAQQSGEMMTFTDITRKFGLTAGEVEQTVRLNLLAKKAFAKRLEKDVPTLDGQVKLAHILLATVPLATGPETKPPAPEELKKKDEEQKARADKLLADLKAGTIKFEDAAKQFSDDKASGAQGGVLPYAAKGTYVPEFEKAAFALQKPGDLTPPVKSQFGWHIIKLVQKGSDAPAAEKRKFKDDKINEMVAQQGQLQNWLQSLSRGAEITFNPKPKLFPKK